MLTSCSVRVVGCGVSALALSPLGLDPSACCVLSHSWLLPLLRGEVISAVHNLNGDIIYQDNYVVLPVLCLGHSRRHDSEGCS